MFYSDSSPLELRFWQRSGTIHPKWTKGAWPQFTPTYQHFCNNSHKCIMTEEGKYVSRRRKCLKAKAIVVNGERCEEWGGINTRLQPMALANVAYPYSTSTLYPKDENKSKRLMSIQRSEIVVIMASTLESWSSCPRDMQLVNQNDGCTWNRKD